MRRRNHTDYKHPEVPSPVCVLSQPTERHDHSVVRDHTAGHTPPDTYATRLYGYAEYDLVRCFRNHDVAKEVTVKKVSKICYCSYRNCREQIHMKQWPYEAVAPLKNAHKAGKTMVTKESYEVYNERTLWPFTQLRLTISSLHHLAFNHVTCPS